MVQMRSFLQADPQKEALFLKALPQELHELYKTATPNLWIPVEQIPYFYTCGGDVLFPDEPEPIVALGQAVGEKIYSGLYAFFLRVPTVEFVLKRSTNLWYLFHDSGRFGYENFTKTSLDLYARDYPELAEPIRKMISGNIVTLLTLIGLKPNVPQLINDDPRNWRWHIEIEEDPKKKNKKAKDVKM